MDEATMQQMLEEILKLYSDPTVNDPPYMEKMHPLAEAQYLPAKSFFAECLYTPNKWWRYDCLMALGFHYDLSDDEAIKEKLRDLLLHDEDELIRSAAASPLGSYSVWPEPVLFTALQTDPERDVRVSAFAALYHLAGLPGHAT
jgi:HEAT repeat protein